MRTQIERRHKFRFMGKANAPRYFRNVGVEHACKHFVRNGVCIRLQPANWPSLKLNAHLDRQQVVGSPSTAEILPFSLGTNALSVAPSALVSRGSLAVSAVIFCALTRL